MAHRVFAVSAVWDAVAGLWYVSESDVPGLVAEAETITTLRVRICDRVPELLRLNQHLIERSIKNEYMPVKVIANGHDTAHEDEVRLYLSAWVVA